MIRTNTPFFGPDRPAPSRQIRVISAFHHPANDNAPRRVRRDALRSRALVCRWRYDVASGRLVCRWELADGEAQSGDASGQPRRVA